MRPSLPLRRAVMLVTSLAACAGDATSPGVGAPTSITVITGSQQQGAANAPLPQAIVAKVVDAQGRGVPETMVTLQVITGEGSVSLTEVTTGADGSLTFTWTLGPRLGEQRVGLRVGSRIATTVSGFAYDPQEVPPLDVFRLLTLQTFEGSGQTVHPDVAGSSETPTWLVLTPYPNGNANDENPSLFARAGAATWLVPDGLDNPVAKPPAGGYLSDPDLVLDPATHQLWLFYREVSGGRNVVRLRRSDDGVAWGTERQLISVPSHGLVSPTVVHREAGSPWMMWSVNSGPAGCSAAVTTIERRTSPDGLAWSAPVTVDLAQPGQVIWHLDVEWIAARHEYWALYNTYAPGGTCTTGALYLATSTDGIHWNTFPSPVAARGVIPAFADIIYRSTFSVDGADGTVTFWISGADFTTGRGYVWRTAVVTRPIAELLGQVASRFDLHFPEARPGLPPPEPDGLGN